MEPKPAPPEEPDFDAPGTEVPVTVNSSPVSAPAENTIDNVIEKPADPNVEVATEPEPLPEVPQVASEQPAASESQQPVESKPDAKPEHMPLPELHEKAPVPKPVGNSMAMIIFGTMFFVVALSMLAVYAYMQSK